MSHTSPASAVLWGSAEIGDSCFSLLIYRTPLVDLFFFESCGFRNFGVGCWANGEGFELAPVFFVPRGIQQLCKGTCHVKFVEFIPCGDPLFDPFCKQNGKLDLSGGVTGPLPFTCEGGWACEGGIPIGHSYLFA